MSSGIRMPDRPSPLPLHVVSARVCLCVCVCVCVCVRHVCARQFDFTMRRTKHAHTLYIDTRVHTRTGIHSSAQEKRKRSAPTWWEQLAHG
ncbi:hypothetical protein EON66_03725 [archaeon]|nr:MAG: hypothetical protein EON66_03725 [archaeon]